MFKFFSPQKKLITLSSSPNFPLYSQQKKYILFFFYLYIFISIFTKTKYNTCYKKIHVYKKIHCSGVEIIKCSIVQLKILMFKSCKILCFLVVNFVVFFLPCKNYKYIPKKPKKQQKPKKTHTTYTSKHNKKTKTTTTPKINKQTPHQNNTNQQHYQNKQPTKQKNTHPTHTQQNKNTKCKKNPTKKHTHKNTPPTTPTPPHKPCGSTTKK